MKKRALFLFLLAFVSACARPPEGVPLEPVDETRLTIYHNGTVITMEDGQPLAVAIAIRGEKIEAVGANEEILALAGSDTTFIDLNGQTLMPGFVDAHTHILNDHRSEGMSLDEAQAEALKNGITSLGTLYVDESFLREIQAFDAEGYLRVRTSLYLVATDPCGNPQGDWWKKYVPTRVPGEMLRINGVKVFTDGGSCGDVALNFEMEPGGGLGDLWFTQDELNKMVAEIDAAGFQAAVHAIGDRAVVQALNAIELALDGRPNTLRHRMEHVSVIPLDQISRFGELGITPVLNGQYPTCTPFGPPIPEGFQEMEWPWRTLRETNPDLQIAWHSDVPFLSGNPFIHLLGFTTRIDRFQGFACPPKDWLRDDTLPVEEALSIMTRQSAYALFREEEVGSLTAGKYADLIVLSDNPLTIEPTELASIRVLLTVVGGRVEYCWPNRTDLCPNLISRTPVPLPDLRPPVFVRWLGAVLFLLLPFGAMALRKRHNAVVRKVGGWAGLAGGVMWLTLMFLNGWGESPLLIFSPFFLAFGAVGFASLWDQGRLGKLGLWMAVIGGVAFTEGVVVSDWFLNDLGWGLFMLGLLTHALGMVFLGIANLRGRALPRWNGLPLGVGLLGGPIPLGLGFILPESSDLPLIILFTSLGIGWLLMGWLILAKKPASEPPS